MRRLSTAVALAALCACVVGSAAGTAANPPFVGVWKGSVRGSTGGSIAVVVTIGAKPRSASSGTISYPARKCVGKLEFLKGSGRVLVLREKITSGTCPRGGSIELTQVDFRTLSFAWYGTGASTPAAQGYLALGGR